MKLGESRAGQIGGGIRDAGCVCEARSRRRGGEVGGDVGAAVDDGVWLRRCAGACGWGSARRWTGSCSSPAPQVFTMALDGQY